LGKGTITHIEFPADDVERAKRFYTAVVGWQYQEMEGFPDYYMFQNGPESGGAIGKRSESVSDTVRIYVNVDSLEEAVKAAEANGGRVVAQPQEVPGQGRFAAVLDPEGNEVGLWEPAQGAATG
jgi:hypothetical protein